MRNLPIKKIKIVSKEDHWISLSDMMTSLMIVFLLISVIYMIKVQDSVRVPQIYKETMQGLSEALNKEFEKDLKGWGAVIDKDLTIRFQQPDITFDRNSANLKLEFKKILDDFFPRYINIMMSNNFINNIEEIRIEGHTSSEGNYFNNMELSQDRSRTALEYIMSSSNINLTIDQKEWLKKHFRAIGYSFAKPLNKDGLTLQEEEKEDFEKSRRVEFRVRTNIEDKVAEIVEKSR
ncbi:OmpA/MotB family protein [Aliarcobacter butzleri]|uniref:OmpA/MotB family protein n=1 Tax=Aliarcobacter butzleri TaxID=28197 RepID=UPI003AF9B2E4